MDAREVLTRTADLPDAVVRYADHPDGVLDLYLPHAATPRPLVLLVHGGFWKQQYDRRHVRPLAVALRTAGYVVAVPEYRRVQRPAQQHAQRPARRSGGDHPVGPGTDDAPGRATLEDVDTVAATVHDLVAGLGVPVTATSYVGHSAGGHLALWLADQGHRVDRVVALAPVADLRAAAAAGLGEHATEAFLGGTPDEVPGRYDAADPMVRLGPGTPPELVVLHGADDDVVPVEISRRLAAAHPEVDLRVLDGVEHFGVIDPLSPAWPVLLDALPAP